MINVVLLSCERPEYTARTIETFLEHNPQPDPRFHLWHCDDASKDRRVRALADKAGFVPLVYTTERIGCTGMIRRAARCLDHDGAEWMMLLENDWETDRPFPWAVFDAVRARGDIWAMRLFGRYKERGDRLPAGARHRGRDGADPRWEQFEAGGEVYEVGSIHWGNPPSVARVSKVAWLHKNAHREKDAIVKSGAIEEKVARVVRNVVYHIGTMRTPGFVS